MQKVLFEYLIIAFGCLIFLFSLSFDLFYQGSPGFGFQQLVGMSLGLIIIFIGLRYTFLSNQPMWDWSLFLIYLSGILFVGLWPTETFNIHQNILLGMNTLSKRDFALNMVGFIPLGFLMPPLLRPIIRYKQKLWLVAVVAIIGSSASLVIETLQYLWVPGRFSSAYDLATNTLGTIIGAVCYVFLINRRVIPQKI